MQNKAEKIPEIFMMFDENYIHNYSLFYNETHLTSIITEDEPNSIEYNWAILSLSFFAIVGFTGNLLVCLAIKFYSKLQTITNYYLVALAFTDLFVSVIVIPLTIVKSLYSKSLQTIFNLSYITTFLLRKMDTREQCLPFVYLFWRHAMQYWYHAAVHYFMCKFSLLFITISKLKLRIILYALKNKHNVKKFFFNYWVLKRKVRFWYIVDILKFLIPNIFFF